MLEARTFVTEIETARHILNEHKSILKGEYRCRDIIFRSKDSQKDLDDEFLRLRINEKNIWDEKDVIVSIKQTEKRGVGKNSIIKIRKEFDLEEEAREYIKQNFQNNFEEVFEFIRTGWQYDLGNDQVDLERVEDVKNCYTIEVKSRTEYGLQNLLHKFNIKNIITGSTAMEMSKRLQSI